LEIRTIGFGKPFINACPKFHRQRISTMLKNICFTAKHGTKAAHLWHRLRQMKLNPGLQQQLNFATATGCAWLKHRLLIQKNENATRSSSTVELAPGYLNKRRESFQDKNLTTRYKVFDSARQLMPDDTTALLYYPLYQLQMAKTKLSCGHRQLQQTCKLQTIPNKIKDKAIQRPDNL